MNFKKWILGAGVLTLLAAAFLFIKPPPPPSIKLPNPNGYDDLVKAGETMVRQRPDCNFNNAECIEEWKSFLEKNKPSLELARVGLSRNSRVPMDRTNHAVRIFQSLALSFQAEGRIAEKENRLGDAIESYLDIVRCSQKMRGGAIIDTLISLAMESVGMESLQNISDKMTAEQRRKVIQVLSDVSSHRETFDEVMVMEKSFDRRSTTLSEKISNLRYFFSNRDVARKTDLRMKYNRTRLDLLLIELAFRNFKTEKGGFPKTLNELVPNYLPFLPKDSFSGNDFIYHPASSGSNGFQLYSVGYDETDDGGKSLSDRTTEAKGDLLMHSPF